MDESVLNSQQVRLKDAIQAHKDAVQAHQDFLESQKVTKIIQANKPSNSAAKR
nr:MAG TPA_asm: hypothetical protein [Caudoviricetes sp.]